MEITKGRQNIPYKVVIYGPEGIGKSTFASKFPTPVFIDTEGSTARLDVARFPKPTSWEHLAEIIRYVIANKPCETLVIDTADWAQALASEYIISHGGEKIRSIEDFGYGKGYTILAENFGRFLNKLTEVRDSGINVLLTAHAMLRKFEQPDEMGAYDRWELKLEKKVSPLVKEWADMILFANYKTQVIEDPKTKTKKAFGGHRVMYTTHTPVWDAKNRDGLPDELPFEYSSIAHLFNSSINSTLNQTVMTKTEEVIQKDVIIEEGKHETDLTPNVAMETKEINYPPELPQKIIDLLMIKKAGPDVLLKAIGPAGGGGRGYFPDGTEIKSIPEAFWNHVAANWEEEFKPCIEKLMMDIPY